MAEGPGSSINGLPPIVRGVSCYDSWCDLPNDSLSYIINQCGLTSRDIAATRRVCRLWRLAVDATIARLNPLWSSFDQLLRVPRMFPLLSHLGLYKFDNALLRGDARLMGTGLRLSQALELLQQVLMVLQQLPLLTSLAVSSQWAQQLGSKLWAQYHISSVTGELCQAGHWAALYQQHQQELEQPTCRALYLPQCLGQLSGLQQLQVVSQDGGYERSRSSLWLHQQSLQGLTGLQVLHTLLGAFPAEVLQLRGLQHLCLRGCGLAQLPAGIRALSGLTALVLTDNDLTELPNSIGELRALQLLLLGHNRLRALPPAIGHLTALAHLELNHNHISLLPAELSSLQSLTHLTLSHNYLQALRGAGGEAGFQALCHLSSLASLGLANVSDKNHDLQVPEAISQLSVLTALDLSHNMLADSSAGGLAAVRQLCQLRQLQLAGLKLQRLPAWLPGLTGLTELDAAGNRQLGAAGGEDVGGVVAQLPRLRVVRLGGCGLPAGCLAGVCGAAGGVLECVPAELQRLG